MKKIFFIDFDGTITTTDVCWAMVSTYARDGWEEINRRWENKEISTVECANQTFALFHAHPDQLRAFVMNIEIDPYFADFCHWCRYKAYPIYILSDGYDFNIRIVLDKHQLHIPYYANRLLYNGGFHIECPHLNPDCGHCGTCKTSLMQSLKEENSLAVYIGDGYSDTCPARHADMVFAKDRLYSYCREHGIPALEFSDFSHILAYLE
ncbi:MAG: MtnX-like HAD-IB family phosphatase [Syntrophomonadaceae bacterium]